ncbi:MAG: hypothetical protein HFF36_10030 [Coprobacillus sp.]|nr:hypothetical protein [Coprobacillus sp.]MCI9094101.1 hypothetical protein [Coprobacillus sp.]
MVIEMKKKFKEYRMFLLCIMMLCVFVGMAIYYFINKSMPRFIAMLIFSFIALTLVLGRFNIVLFDDSMILYEWKLAAMLPIIVDYKDIKNIEKRSKHCIIVEHKKKTNIYVFNSEKFLETYYHMNKKDK